MSEPSIRVLLFRTGQTEWEAQGRIGGSTDVPISAQGIAKVEAGIGQLAGTTLGTIYCGPDDASRVTASTLAASTGGKVKILEDLAEIHLGLWEGMLEQDLGGKCPAAFRMWCDDPALVTAPEGESIQDVRGRLLEAVAKVLDRARPGHGAIALVLRPIALGVVQSAIDGTGFCKSLWHQTRNGYQPQWRTLDRTMIEQVRELAVQPLRR